jgi:hypothetical protein
MWKIRAAIAAVGFAAILALPLSVNVFFPVAAQPGPQPQPPFTGGTLSQELILAPSTTGASGLNVAPGVAPSAPAAGDLWSTSAGLFARFGGVTTGPITGANGSSGQLQTNNAGALAGITLGGDCTFTTPNILCLKTNGSLFVASAIIDTTNASNISSGTLAAARGGAGTVNGALKGNGAGLVTQAACGDLSNAQPSCSTDTTNASNISSGTLPGGRMPALSGDVASTVGTTTTTIQPGAVTGGPGGKIANTTITAANIVNATITTTQIAASTITGGNIALSTIANNNFALPGGRNLAARFGSMDVWQRGAGGTASIAVAASTTAYTVDGCYLATGATQASTVANVAGQLPGSYRAASITRNSGQTGTTLMTFGCPFDTDEIAQFQGQFVTLSFTATTGANWSPASGTLNAILNCGTGAPVKFVLGTYAGATTPINTPFNIAAGTAAARYQVTSAAIVPTNCTQSEIDFTWTPVGTAGASDTVTIDDVQLELAPASTWTASIYDRKDFATQLALAQRHYVKTFPYGVAPAAANGLPGSISVMSATANLYVHWRYPVQMRAAPTLTSFNPVTAASANCRNVSAGTDSTFTADTNEGTGGAGSIAAGGQCAGTGTINQLIYVQFAADAGI